MPTSTSIYLITDLKSYEERFLLLKNVFHAKEVFSDDPKFIKHYPNIELKKPENITDKATKFLITCRHPHSVAKKYHIPFDMVLKPLEIRAAIVNSLNSTESTNALLTRDFFDASYLKYSLQGLKEIDENLGDICTVDASLCRLKLFPNWKYQVIFFAKLIQLKKALLKGKIHPKDKRNDNSERRGTLILWNMTDPFFISDIIKRTAFNKYVLRIIDNRSRVSFPKTLELMARHIPEFHIDSYEETFASPIMVYPQTISYTLCKKVLEENPPAPQEKPKALFYGWCNKERALKVVKLGKDLQRLGVDVEIKISPEEKFNDASLDSYILKEPIGYNNYLKKVACANIIIEIMREGHNASTFRALEALIMEKKLITNNLTSDRKILENENVFVIGRDQDLEGFVKKEFSRNVLRASDLEALFTENYLASRFHNDF